LRSYADELADLGNEASIPIKASIPIFREFLSACSAEGVSKLDKDSVRAIVFTLVWIAKNKIRSYEPLVTCRDIAFEVLAREDLDETWAEVKQLKEILNDSSTSRNDLGDVASLKEMISPDAWKVVEHLEWLDAQEYKNFTEVSVHWERMKGTVADRSIVHEIDLLLLSLSLRLATPLSIQFLEGLYLDEDFWKEPAVIAWSHDRAVPVDEDVFGVVQSAMINSRLRTLIPRAFLRRPSALVIDKMSDVDDVAKAKSRLTDDIGTQIWAAVFQLDDILTAKTIGKKRVKDLRDMFASYLSTLSLRLIGKVNDEESFDPDKHQGIVPLTKGIPVRILEPGLQSTHDGRIVRRAMVVPQDEVPKSESERS
jgi:hypothetical protein